MSLPLPEDWVEDSDYLDARRSIGNLACPRQGVAGLPVTSLRPAHFLRQGWNSYWLRWIAQGKEVYFVVARTKPEMVLVGEILTQLRNQTLDLDAAATNHAVQTQPSQAKNLAVKALAQHLVDCLRQKIPVETDQESQDRIRELESQLGDLQQRQKNSAGSPAPSTTMPGTPAPSTLSGNRAAADPRSPPPATVSSSPGSNPSPKPPAALATPGQPHKQLPLSFSLGAAQTASATPEPAELLHPPAAGSSWLAADSSPPPHL